VQRALSAWIALVGAPAFSRVYRLDRALRRKLTPAGWVVAALLVACAIFGLNTREVLVYQLFGLSLGLLAVAALASWRLRVSADATRSLPRVATAGVAFDYTVTLRNAGGAIDSVVVEDVVEAPRGDPRDFAAYKVSEDRRRNLFDRMVGYPRWVEYMRLRTGARIEPVTLDTLPARSERAVRMRCEPLRRGVLAFRAVRIARFEPLGLMKAHAWCTLPETLVVMPRTYPVAPLQLPGSRRLQPGGVAFAGRVGDAEEFVSLRDYRAGDTPRRIHWKAWARTGRPVVKEYQDEFFVRHALILDTFGSADEESFEAAVSLAASLVMMPRSLESLLDLMFVAGRAYTLTQGRGLGASSELLRVLAAVSPSRQGSFDSLAETVALGAARMSGAICVLLAWDEPRRRMVAHLRGRGIPVRVWVVCEAGDALEPGPMASDPGNLRRVHASNLAAELLRP
jgi:uncharacterized protein (DUF58 family)